MLRGIVLMLALCACALAPHAVLADGPGFVLFSGFDFQTDGAGGPDLTPASLSIGEGFASVGIVSAFVEPLASLADFGAHEYTIVISGVAVVSSSSFAGFVAVTGAGGRVDVYEDARAGGTAATYGANPPDAASLSTFTDGLLILSAPAVDFIYLQNGNTGQGNWSFGAVPDGGAWLEQVPPVPGGCFSYAVGAQFNTTDPSIPAGYLNLTSGEYAYVCGDPVENSTWGGLKSRYR